MSSSSSTAPTTTKRACDACHRRKVRCDGTNPCHNCAQANLACTFDKIPLKKGPKGSRAKVISELRKNQELSRTTGGLPDGPSATTLLSPSSRHPTLINQEMIDVCLKFFFETLYYTVPILDKEFTYSQAAQVKTSNEAYCLIGSLCAYITIQPGLNAPYQPPLTASANRVKANNALGRQMLDEVQRVRNSIDYQCDPTTASIVTSFLISATYFGIENHNCAWYHLQEAVLLARVYRIHQEASYLEDGRDHKLNRRLFWVLFVSERAQALQKHRDLTFSESLQFPKPSEDPSDLATVRGFACLIDLFRIVDDDFSRIWNCLRCKTPPVWPPNTAEWIASMQSQLSAAVPLGLELHETQEADLRITQQWLRIMVWQLATASGNLSSMTNEIYMSFSYPFEIARELDGVLRRLSFKSIEVHGVGIIEKLFDIACTLADVMSLDPASSPPSLPFELGPRDHLSNLLQLITSLHGGESRFVKLLHTRIRETLPGLASTYFAIPPRPPLTTSASNLSRDSVQREGSSASSRSSPYGSPVGSVVYPYQPSAVLARKLAETSGIHSSAANTVGSIPTPVYSAVSTSAGPVSYAIAGGDEDDMPILSPTVSATSDLVFGTAAAGDFGPPPRSYGGY